MQWHRACRIITECRSQIDCSMVEKWTKNRMPLRILDKTKIASPIFVPPAIQCFNGYQAPVARLCCAQKGGASKVCSSNWSTLQNAACSYQVFGENCATEEFAISPFLIFYLSCFCFLIVCPRLSINCLLQSFSFSFFAYTCCAIATLCPITSASSCALSIL